MSNKRRSQRLAATNSGPKPSDFPLGSLESRAAARCLRVFVCENLAFHGDYFAVLAKHSKHFSLEDSMAIGVDRMQRNFGPMKQQVEEWQGMQLSTAAAKLLIYEAFIEEESGFPKHLARRVHDLYFRPVHEEFQPRTMWSFSNAFTSAFKELEPIPQYKATAKLAGFLQAVRAL